MDIQSQGQMKPEDSKVVNILKDGDYLLNATEEQVSIELEKVRETSTERLKRENLQEIYNLANKIDPEDLDTIQAFGEGVEKSISEFADKILRTMRANANPEQQGLFKELADIMKEFDMTDFRNLDSNEQVGFLKKLFRKAQKTLDELFQHYTTVGDKVDKVYVKLKGYETDISSSNKVLREMYKKIGEYFIELQKYIIAGDMGAEHIKDVMIKNQEEIIANDPGDQMATMKLNDLNLALSTLRTRVDNLRKAEIVALQSMPMIKSIEKGNITLVGRIKQSFIVTLPLFKIMMIEYIQVRDQAIKNEAMNELDELTNKAMEKSAQMVADSMRKSAESEGKSSINIETLETTHQIIIQGILDAKEITKANDERITSDAVKMSKLKEEMEKYI